MKKIVSLLLAVTLISGLVLTLASCSTSASAYEIALITDVGTIDDKSFNQGSWEGVEAYAKDNNKTYKYYKPAEATKDAALAAIDLAVKGGAKIIVTPGFLFEQAIYAAQDLYPDIKFIFIDGAPNNGGFEGEYSTKINDNVQSIFYAEEEAGFLAGYASVIDGKRNLGFMGGIAVPAVIRFGYGFVQGANYAAKELGLNENDVKIKYNYTGTFEATPEVQTKAASWYQSGTEVIFACGGAIGDSVMAAAEAAKAQVIGVDTDQSHLSETVLTSAIKELKQSVYDSISSFYEGNFVGGQAVIKTVSENMVGLTPNFDRFETFKQSDYDLIYDKLVAKDITVISDHNNGTAVSLNGLDTKYVTIEEIQ